jgi:uncharacterized protein (DUF2461 family)
VPIQILTPKQHSLVKQRAADTDFWRDESDLERRRRVGQELREVVKKSGVLDGKTLEHRQLCEMVGLQWQVQNLNPMQMPKFLGLYAYKVHFGGFPGTREELLAKRKEETGEEEMYPGADLVAVSKALRHMASQSREDQGRGASTLLSIPGAGAALVSGFLHLLHPNMYGLVNTPTKAPFVKDGWLGVTEQQRKSAYEKALASFSNSKELPESDFHELFRWEMFLEEVLQLCKFMDYHELDQFLWTVAAEPEGNADERLEAAVQDIGQDDLAARVEAEKKARKLVEEHLGHLSSDDFSTLFTLINTCAGKKGVVYTRFVPAFVGHNANLLIEKTSQLNTWIKNLWNAKDEELPALLSRFWEEDFTGGGRSFPTAILYLRDKQKYAVWTSNLEKALYSVIPGLPAKFRTGFSYLQYCKGVHQLRRKVPFPPEMHDFVLFKLITRTPSNADALPGDFAGFTLDAFTFMDELVKNNNQAWFDTNRQRFKESVDKPLRALVKDLGDKVITALDPELETSPTAGKCISRIRKNLWGKDKAGPYQDLYWAAFYRKDLSKNTDCQLFMSIRATWFQHGIYFGEHADSVREQLKGALQGHPKLAETIYDRLKNAGFLFATGDDKGVPEPIDIDTYDSFAKLVTTSRFHVYRRATPDETVAAKAALMTQVGNDFRSLYPLFRLATSTGISKLIDDGGGDEEEEDDTSITISDLAAATYLEEDFFATLDMYLKDKKQVVFCGPPGTGKTFVALKYADYLAQGGGEIRTVQFHPSYGYEDFVEGLRPAAAEHGTLTYKVEDGIFKQLCNDARTKPKTKHVLLIDEINRGNIPRIFGELLFLLERREHKTLLPYSKKEFSIPQNVFVLGTMNSSDRSIALMDLALRRRFHFMEMQPRAEVLLGWLQANGRPKYIRDVFCRLNDALRKAGIDEERLVGHAHFMSQYLGEDYIALIWKGTIEPLLKEYFFAEPDRLADFRLEKFQSVIEEAVAIEAASEEDEADEELVEGEGKS